MFTLKFYTHVIHSRDPAKHEVFSCERYSVEEERCEPEDAEEFEQPTRAPMRTVIRMYRAHDDENPHHETVGPRELYGHCFVVNEGGRTIDTLR